jgi:hypothetical protein
MKTIYGSCILIFSLTFAFPVFSQQADPSLKLNTAIDNQGYWRAAAELGLTRPNPQRSVTPAIFTGSEIRALSVLTEDSPDVLLISGATSQSENSVFVNPNDAANPLNSNNSTNQPGGGTSVYGANYLYSFDEGLTWDGSIQGAGGANSGDPTTAISLSGRYYIGFINNSSGQSVAYSDNQGGAWTPVTVANAPSGFGNMLDKNHMWIDNSTTSPYEGNLYNAWTAFGGSNDNDIEISRSADNGLTWSTPINISQVINAGSHSQGVNIQTGPNGEVYAVFCIYDNWPSDEDALGLARSFDGGQTYETYRIIENIKGIRSSGTGKNMRVNSFPSMAVDISTGPNRGNIYVTWTNTGVPGVNAGSDVDVYMIRSEDDGDTWSEPIRVNQDPSGMGKKHYFGWITSDPATGTLSMIFYDDRNVSGSQVQVFCANSTDAGDTWEDFQVSDVTFTPSPIPGLASQYFGDYLGITARNGKVYPVWTDNRTGTALTYCSPYVTSTMVAPSALNTQLEEETGAVTLTWSHQAGPTFDHYNIYRGFTLVGQTTFPFYVDTLPDYGTYRYQVTAYYTVEGESAPAIADVQWGNGQAQVTPENIEVYIATDETASVAMTLDNVGELPLTYNSAFSLPEGSRDGSRDYCTGFGGCGEGISGVTFGDVSNFSQCGNYEDYSALSTMVTIGDSLQVTVYNITNMYPEDICGIWIDWNQNGSLLDDEDITVNGSPGTGPYTATIVIPEGAKNGDARMRIRIRRGGTLSPCGSAPNGEVEDYSLNVLAWVTASPRKGTIEAGEGQEITFNFNSAGMPQGSYQADFTIFSNDPDNSELIVPVTMNVDMVSVTITADADSVCQGESTTLHANINGSSGSFTYSWTSDPPGFESAEPDPVVTPLVTTTYYVTATDGNNILEDEITITALSLPEVGLGDDISVCESGEATFDAGPGFDSYLWSNGEGGQSITVSEPGIYWVEVSNTFGCPNRDTVIFEINPLPEISLGPDLMFCENTDVMLSAGAGFSSYLWNTGETSESIYADEEGDYWVEIVDENGCVNRDTIFLAAIPVSEINLGDDMAFCEGSQVTLNAGSGFNAYLWSTGATSAAITAGEPGEYWVEVTNDGNCTNRDTIELFMDPLPIAPETISGPSSVDNYLNPTSGFTCSESFHANSYKWKLEPEGAGSIAVIGAGGPEASITWATEYTGTAHISVCGVNDCGDGNYTSALDVSVYSSQEVDELMAISGIKLFPNPNDGNFILYLNARMEQELTFRLSNSGGNQISELKETVPAGIYQKNFNLGILPGGTYYLIIADAKGKMLSRQQVIIQ